MITMKIIKPIDLNKILNNRENQSGRNKTLDKILEEIKSAKNILICTHESPDGDAIGSLFALNIVLKILNKTPDMYLPNYPRIFEFLPTANEVKEKLENQKYDLAISVDCADLKILNGKEFFENSKKTIVIDHHGTNNMYGDINYVNPASPACSEILISIFQYYNINITKDIGTCLLTGIITDTGGFRYQGVTPETFEFAAELLRKGVDISDIYTRVLQTKTRAKFELSKKVMERVEMFENDKIIFTYITNKDEKELNLEPGDTEGLVEIGRDIEGVKVSILIKQKENKDLYKVSMRSNENINVSDICFKFGGGGHPRAAGCLIKGDIDTVKHTILKEINKVI